jgi:hypothetical protein
MADKKFKGGERVTFSRDPKRSSAVVKYGVVKAVRPDDKDKDGTIRPVDLIEVQWDDGAMDLLHPDEVFAGGPPV